ncbi:MAG: hypothetical protein FWC60_00060, partial [Firmicutes bacterium]|nr:hypothetical protein [Bacillota bacterium]
MARKVLFLLLAAVFFLNGLPLALAGNVSGGPAMAPVKPAIVSPAAHFIEAQLAGYDYRRYVYKDYCAGENSYTQKAFIGDNYGHIPAMDEAAAGYAGISGISAALDLNYHSWGGYMFVNGGLKAGSQSAAADFGVLKDGLSLTGAAKLVFYAKGQTGNEQVEFFMGGLGWQNGRKLADAPYPDSTDKISLGYVHLTKDWKQYEIPLTGADLSHVNCGFGWVTNNTSNPGLAKVAFAVDEIYYLFPQKQSPMVFLSSYAPAKTNTDDYVVNNFAYAYDNAMAVMVLCYVGKPERAKQIADALVYAVNNDRDYHDGRIRNAYSSGDPRSFPNWYSAGGKAFVRLPGFILFKDMQWYEDQGTLSTSTGNAAWVIMALMEAYRTIGDESYLRAAQRIGDFVLTLKSSSGGFTGGY